MAGAYDILRTRLYSQPPDSQLLISPRRRGSVTFGPGAVGVGRLNVTAGFPAFQPGDLVNQATALLLEEWAVDFSSNDNTGGTTLVNLNLTLKLAGGLEQPFDAPPAQFAQQITGFNGAALFIKQTPNLLYSSMDLHAANFNPGGGAGGFLPETLQPLQFRINAIVASTVAGSTVNFLGYVFYRIIKGFQEG